jgi:hypothetical protein
VSSNPVHGDVCVLDSKFCDKFCQWITRGRWFSPGTPVSSTNNTDHHNIAYLYHIMLYLVHLVWTGFELTTFVVIVINCICSCKSNYHTITITTAPFKYLKKSLKINIIWTRCTRCVTNPMINHEWGKEQIVLSGVCVAQFLVLFCSVLPSCSFRVDHSIGQ